MVPEVATAPQGGAEPVAASQPQPALSVVIKALDEAGKIEACLRSVLAATDPETTEIIVADSLSEDQTVAVASRFPVKVVQLARIEDRGCGSAAQLGYQHARGRRLLLLDGDMELDPGFLPAANATLDADPKLAGVGGMVVDRVMTLEFRRRQKKLSGSDTPGLHDHLNGGGLFRMEAIRPFGYLTDRNLHSCEELELGIRLTAAGWRLRRFDQPSVYHYGHATAAFPLLLRRWRTRYLHGHGEVLRAKWNTGSRWRVVRGARLYFAAVLWWGALLCLLAAALVSAAPALFSALLAVTSGGTGRRTMLSQAECGDGALFGGAHQLPHRRHDRRMAPTADRSPAADRQHHPPSGGWSTVTSGKAVFEPDEQARLQEAGTSLAGRIAIGAGTAALFRRGVGRLWPDVAEVTGFRLAIDGYLVHDGRFLLGGPDEARAVAAAFRTDPANFMAGIDNGCCNIVAHDQDRKITVIASDPSGCLPLYIHVGRDTISFANDFPGLQVIAPPLVRDPLGCAELYWFGYPIADRTIFRDVFRTPPGAILTIDWRDGRIATETWARPAERQPPGDPSETGRDLIAAMRTACRRLQVPGHRYGIKLSGGMDSRLIAGSWQDPALRAFTFTAPGTIECGITRRLARALAIPLAVTTLEGDFFSSLNAPIFPKHAVMDFFHHALLPEMQAAGIDCALDGIAGDVLFGGLALKRKGGLRAALQNLLGAAAPSFGDLPDEAAAADRLRPDPRRRRSAAGLARRSAARARGPEARRPARHRPGVRRLAIPASRSTAVISALPSATGCGATSRCRAPRAGRRSRRSIPSSTATSRRWRRGSAAHRPRASGSIAGSIASSCRGSPACRWMIPCCRRACRTARTSSAASCAMGSSGRASAPRCCWGEISASAA